MEIIKVYDSEHTQLNELIEHTKVNTQIFKNSKIKTKKNNSKTIWCNGKNVKIPKECLI